MTYFQTYYQLNRTKVLSKLKAYYQLNRKHLLAMKRLRRARFPEYYRKKDRENYKKKRAIYLARSKAWREAHREKVNRQQRKFYQDNIWLIRVAKKCKVGRQAARKIIETGQVPI